jgi:hypothetical protein
MKKARTVGLVVFTVADAMILPIMKWVYSPGGLNRPVTIGVNIAWDVLLITGIIALIFIVAVLVNRMVNNKF